MLVHYRIVMIVNTTLRLQNKQTSSAVAKGPCVSVESLVKLILGCVTVTVDNNRRHHRVVG